MDPYRSPVPNLDDLSKEQLRQWFLNYEDRHYEPAAAGQQEEGVVRVQKLGYSFNEGYRLLKFIHAFDLHDFVGGNVIWKSMAHMRIVIGNRTWHGIREHFCKTVKRDLVRYRASGEDILKFRQGEIDKNQGRKHIPNRQVTISLQQILAARAHHFPNQQ